MPVINKRTSIAAGATAEPLAGDTFEFLGYPAVVEIGIATSAAGMLASINSGPDILADEGPVPVKAAEALPTYPDDFFPADEAAAGDRLRVKLRNTSGGTLVVLTQVRITPL